MGKIALEDSANYEQTTDKIRSRDGQRALAWDCYVKDEAAGFVWNSSALMGTGIKSGADKNDENFPWANAWEENSVPPERRRRRSGNENKAFGNIAGDEKQQTSKWRKITSKGLMQVGPLNDTVSLFC